MIKMYDQVPQVYLDASRDFQYISWLTNIVFNYVKHNVSSMSKLPGDTSDPRITELLALTLGFKVKRKYDQKQLAALVIILPSILRYKGTKTAIDLAGNALLKASGAAGDFFSDVIDGKTLEALMPKELVDTTLFMDLLPYILPAGMTCKIVRKTKDVSRRVTEVIYDDAYKAEWFYDKNLGELYYPSVSNTNDKISDANFIPKYGVDGEPVLDEDGHNVTITNIGLMSNSMMPTLDSTVHDTQRNEEESDV